MKAKAFDCVEMKRRGAERVLRQTRELSLEEEIAYWCQRTQDLRQRREAKLPK